MEDRELIEIPLDDRDAELFAIASRVLQIILVRHEPGTARQIQQLYSQHADRRRRSVSADRCL